MDGYKKEKRNERVEEFPVTVEGQVGHRGSLEPWQSQQICGQEMSGGKTM